MQSQIKTPPGVAGIPPESLNEILRPLSPAEQDEVLAKMSDQDLDAFAVWSNKNNPVPENTAVTQINGRQVVHKSDAKKLEDMSDDELAALAKQEGLDIPPAVEELSGGWLNNNLGLGLRAGMKGATALPGLVFDAVAEPGVTGTAMDKIADALGARRPQDSDERIGSDVIGGIAGALAGGGVARGVGGSVGAVLGRDLGAQALAGGTGGFASGTVRERGGSTRDQIVAGLLGALAPGALASGASGAVRTAVRGTGGDLAKMRDTIKTFETAGTVPTVGQATGGEKAQAVEGFLSRLFGSSGQVRKRVLGQEEAIGQAVEERAKALSPKTSNEAMGTRIGSDAENIFMPNSRKLIDEKYDRYYNLVPKSTIVPVGRVGALLDEMTSVIPGAKNISENTKLNPSRNEWVGLFNDLKKDVKANGGKGLPLEAVKEVRTRMGKLLEKATFDSDIDTGEIKRLYGALSEEMKDAAGPVGSASRKAFDDANSATQQYHAILDTVRPVLNRNGGPEQVFKSALSGSKEGGTVLRNVYYTLSPEGRKVMTAAILRRAAKPGGADPEDFDMKLFAKNYKTMDDEAKKVVFGALGGNYRQDLDKIADTINIIAKQREEFGLATTASQGNTGAHWVIGAALLSPGAAATGGGMAGLATGAGVAGGFFGANRLAKWMMDPKTVKWLAKTTNLPREAVPAAVNELAQEARRNKDPEQAELAEHLKSQLGEQ